MSLKLLSIFLITSAYLVGYADTVTTNNDIRGAAWQDPAGRISTSITTGQLPTTTTSLEFLAPWARASISVPNSPGNSAAYLTLKNDSDTDYRLVNVSSDIANQTELHQTITDNAGVSQMVKVRNMVIPHNSQVEFQPGGTHIMLLNLRKPLNVNDRFDISFFFSDGSQETVEFAVK